MRFARFRQNLLYTVVILMIFAALHNSGSRQAQSVREYIRYAVTTDFDVDAIVQKAKGLGSFSSRINWQSTLRALAPAKYAPESETQP